MQEIFQSQKVEALLTYLPIILCFMIMPSWFLHPLHKNVDQPMAVKKPPSPSCAAAHTSSHVVGKCSASSYHRLYGHRRQEGALVIWSLHINSLYIQLFFFLAKNHLPLWLDSLASLIFNGRLMSGESPYESAVWPIKTSVRNYEGSWRGFLKTSVRNYIRGFSDDHWKVWAKWLLPNLFFLLLNCSYIHDGYFSCTCIYSRFLTLLVL